jgi:hypothetical protein
LPQIPRNLQIAAAGRAIETENAAVLNSPIKAFRAGVWRASPPYTGSHRALIYRRVETLSIHPGFNPAQACQWDAWLFREAH